MSSPESDETRATEDRWAKPISRLNVAGLPAGAVNLNVQGKQLAGPVRGFGQMWQKTYRIKFEGVHPAPEQVICEWKDNFSKFWPKGNELYSSSSSISPGDVGVINTRAPGNVPLVATGVYVIYADDVSFSFMTPQGHPWAGLVTFSADEEEGDTFAQVQVLVRANDPIWEIGMRIGMSKSEDQFWLTTVKNVAAHFGASGEPNYKSVIVDPGVQWREWKNIWHNAGIRTGLYTLAAPVRWVKKQFGAAE